MSGFTVAWILWALTFIVVEALAIAHKDRPGKPATLSAHVWWVVRGAGPWHTGLRMLLVAGLGWLAPHLLS